jgi:hypothetical protein
MNFPSASSEKLFWQAVAHHEAAHAVAAHRLIGGNRPFERIIIRRDLKTNPIVIGDQVLTGYHGVVLRPVLYPLGDLQENQFAMMSPEAQAELAALMKADAQITLAGNIAENEWGARNKLRRHAVDDGYDADNENAKGILRQFLYLSGAPLIRRKRDLQNLFRATCDEALRTVRQEWQDIEALAKAVLARGELSYEEAHSMIEAGATARAA